MKTLCVHTSSHRDSPDGTIYCSRCGKTFAGYTYRGEIKRGRSKEKENTNKTEVDTKTGEVVGDDSRLVQLHMGSKWFSSVASVLRYFRKG
jgi:hypothetical protein